MADGELRLCGTVWKFHATQMVRLPSPGKRQRIHLGEFDKCIPQFRIRWNRPGTKEFQGAIMSSKVH